MSKKAFYKIIFQNQGKVYEIFAKSISQGALFGFIEVAQIVFGEKSSLVVDPAEENLKAEFANVSRIHIPLHSVIRIDEVNKQGTAKITTVTGAEGKIMPFPVYTRGGNESGDA
jgi:hypothetical protein